MYVHKLNTRHEEIEGGGSVSGDSPVLMLGVEGSEGSDSLRKAQHKRRRERRARCFEQASAYEDIDLAFLLTAHSVLGIGCCGQACSNRRSE